MTKLKQELIVDQKGLVGVLTLNRPEALNALNHPLMDQLEEALDRFEGDASIRVIVIAGSERAFAAGADISEMQGKTSAQMRADKHLSRWDKISIFPKPTIAAISGYALGGGCELALACDLRVASETAVFGQPEISIGVIPGAGGTVRLARLLGRALALEMILAGRKLSAQKALSLGLVNRVVPVELFLDEAMNLAREIAAKPPLAVLAAKKSVLSALSPDDSSYPSALKFERELFYSLFDTEDQKEGMRAFIEKRKPHFTGK
jgi:enoyl-CoA hydratase